MKQTFFFGLLLLLATGCPPEQSSQQMLEIKYNETKEAAGEQMKLTFRDVNDSRCPKDVQCISAGEAKVMMVVDKGGASENIELAARGLCYEEDGSCGSEATAMGYKFKLLSLNPYPEQDMTPLPEDYVVKVEYSVFQAD
ncbi:MAG: hypothetical protein J5I94_01660 [Phaeodactylibacter sp.]|nr:hypothetical protein [Phaeodactylibacter sp.]